MQPARRRITDVHAGTLANMLQVAEVLKVLGPVFGIRADKFLFVTGRPVCLIVLAHVLLTHP
jgi:hypothetical protein